MLLKRQYQDGKCTSVLVKHTGLSREQNFSRRLVLKALADGWMRIDGTKLTVTGEPEDLVYALKRVPGYYCKSTGERIPVSPDAWAELFSAPPGQANMARREALAFLADKGKPADDYEVTMAYECVLAADQHEKFHGVRAISGNVVAAHTLAGA